MASDVSVVTERNLVNEQIVKEQNANYHNAKLNQQFIDYQRKYDALADWQKELPLDDILKLMQGKIKVQDNLR